MNLFLDHKIPFPLYFPLFEKKLFLATAGALILRDSICIVVTKDLIKKDQILQKTYSKTGLITKDLNDICIYY